MRQAIIHPRLARRIADHVAHHVWDGTKLRQISPGVFLHEPKQLVLAVLGAASISEPAENALRLSGLVWELAVLQDAQHREDPQVWGPRHQLGDERWSEVLSSCVAATRDVQTVFSRFEVMVAGDPSKLACLAEASAMVAAVLPDCPEPTDRRRLIEDVGGWDFLQHLEAEVTRAVEAAF